MSTGSSSPMTADAVLDAYFLETRAKLLEIAATLDRLDRAEGAETVHGNEQLEFIQAALKVLQSGAPGRAEKIQRLYSTG